MQTADQQPGESMLIADSVRPCWVCSRLIATGETVYSKARGNGTRWRHKECRFEVPDPSDEGSQVKSGRGVIYHRGRKTNYSE